MKFGHLLRKKRLEAGVKLRPLARKIGVSHTYLVSIESNTRPPSNRVFEALVSELNIDHDIAVYSLGQLTVQACERLEREPALVALVNQIARKVWKSNLRAIAKMVEDME